MAGGATWFPAAHVDTGMPWLGGVLSCESTGRVGRLRCLDGSRTDTGMPWLGGMLSCESAGRVGRLRCLDGSRATLGHRRQGSSSGNLPPAYALGSRTPGCQCQTVVWLKGEDTWGGGEDTGGEEAEISHADPPAYGPGADRARSSEHGARNMEHGAWEGWRVGLHWGDIAAQGCPPRPRQKSPSSGPAESHPLRGRPPWAEQWRGGYGARTAPRAALGWFHGSHVGVCRTKGQYRERERE